MTARDRAARLFSERYGSPPVLIVRAPGRVNLIGDHTDYNNGFVLPMAIDADVVIAARPRPDLRVRAASESHPGLVEFSLDALTREEGWGEYLKGVAHALDPGSLRGWEGVVVSDLPASAGLSSSAALELAAARVFAELADRGWDPVAMALAGQRAENDWVGMNSGIMDQLISATGRAGHARLIDCRDLTGEDVPLPDQAAIVVLDTGTRRHLLDSPYNDRRAACEQAAHRLGVQSLREVDAATVTSSHLPTELERRARHVVSENDRTTRTAHALTDGDLTSAGELMNASHTSLRDDFEVSSPALDAMAQSARTAPGCFGARQTGGGFAGSCVALVAIEAVDAFSHQTLDAYSRTTGHAGSARLCRAVDGVEII